MREAFTAAARAPGARWRLALALWLARLLPILLFVGLPAFGRIAEASAHHPDAGRLLDAPSDASGFSYAWGGDVVRGPMSDLPETVSMVVILAWIVVTLLAGGITARLLDPGTRLPDGCARFGGRFLRLGLLVLVALYIADVAINTLLADRQSGAARAHHTQDYDLARTWTRGLLTLAVVWILGIVHAYARIDLIRGDRVSAVRSLCRGGMALLRDLPRLLLLEGGLALLTGVGVVGAYFARDLSRLSADASGLEVGAHVVLLLSASYLRTGLEVGAMEARCILLGHRSPQNETAPA